MEVKKRHQLSTTPSVLSHQLTCFFIVRSLRFLLRFFPEESCEEGQGLAQNKMDILNGCAILKQRMFLSAAENEWKFLRRSCFSERVIHSFRKSSALLTTNATTTQSNNNNRKTCGFYLFRSPFFFFLATYAFLLHTFTYG